MKRGTDTESLRIAFKQLTQGTDLTLERLKEATYNAASERSLLENANLSITLGLPVERLPELFNSAMKLGYALGKPTEYSIRSLAIGIGRQSYMVLDNIGVVFRSNEARAWFAKKYGLEKTPVAQYRRAWIEYAIKLVTEKAKALSVSAQSKKAQVERLKARTSDASAQLGVKVV